MTRDLRQHEFEQLRFWCCRYFKTQAHNFARARISSVSSSLDSIKTHQKKPDAQCSILATIDWKKSLPNDANEPLPKHPVKKDMIQQAYRFFRHKPQFQHSWTYPKTADICLWLLQVLALVKFLKFTVARDYIGYQASWQLLKCVPLVAGPSLQKPWARAAVRTAPGNINGAQQGTLRLQYVATACSDI